MYLFKRYISVPLFYDRIGNDQLAAFRTQEATHIDEEGIIFKDRNRIAHEKRLALSFF